MENPQAATDNQSKPSLLKGEVSAQNVSLQPKFLFGLKGDVKTNLYYVDDQTILYPCGHNVVIYNTDDKS